MRGQSNATRSMVLLFAGSVLGLGLFAVKAEAAIQSITLECVPQKIFDVTVAPDAEALTFLIPSGCFCDSNLEALKSLAASGKIISATPRGGAIQLRPGETYELKLYCYTPSTLNPGPAR
jgi:hypothetical protein